MCFCLFPTLSLSHSHVRFQDALLIGGLEGKESHLPQSSSLSLGIALMSVFRMGRHHSVKQTSNFSCFFLCVFFNLHKNLAMFISCRKESHDLLMAIDIGSCSSEYSSTMFPIGTQLDFTARLAGKLRVMCSPSTSNFQSHGEGRVHSSRKSCQTVHHWL